MDKCVVSEVPLSPYSLFKLFFLASIFFLSARDLGDAATLFWTAEAATTTSEDVTATALATLSSQVFGPEPLDAAEAPSGAGGNATLLLATSFFWSTFDAAVHSEITPDLDLGLGLRAWIPVYNLHDKS